MGLDATRSRCGRSGGLGKFRYTTVLLVLGGGGASGDLETQPMAHAKTTACKANEKATAEKDDLRSMGAGGAGSCVKQRGLGGPSI
jgi:hypothetical protein